MNVVFESSLSETEMIGKGEIDFRGVSGRQSGIVRSRAGEWSW